ncbi:MAG TPA: hypothetical protein VMJ35_12140 [Dongiaceae bacterium]|nr:hypothetical protein [Dongiaceae bacterium]
MKRPLIVTLIGTLFIAVGAVGGVAHAKEGPIGWGLALIELSELVALVGGVFLLMGKNWARWLLLVWMGFHVVISAFDSLQKLAVHVVIFGLIAFALLRPPAWQYFRSASS